MSGLAGLLAGHDPPGAYRWHGLRDAAEVQRSVSLAERPFAHLDGARIETMGELHDALARALAFPAHYGRNLDALADCLRDVAADTVLLWDSWGPVARAEPRAFSVALSLLGERLTVLLRGDGPDVDVVSLD